MSGDFVDREAYEAALSPVDPSTPEREAREVMERTLMRYAEIEHPNRDHPALTWKFERDVEADRADLDAYRAAVAAVEYERGRRAERERIAGIVEGMRLPHDGNCSSLWSAEPNHPFCDCQTQPHNAALDALLAKMREAK